MKLFNTTSARVVKNIREISAEELLAVSGGEKTFCHSETKTVTDPKDKSVTTTTKEVCTTYPFM